MFFGSEKACIEALGLMADAAERDAIRAMALVGVIQGLRNALLVQKRAQDLEQSLSLLDRQSRVEGDRLLGRDDVLGAHWQPPEVA